jgi:hypothetical protein
MMERIDLIVLAPSDYAPTHLSTWSRDLRQLGSMATIKFASRDSRRNYRQGRPGRVILVDFDWSGDVKSGVYYPIVLLNEELWWIVQAVSQLARRAQV